MADYKEIITGTFNALVEKVKDVAQSDTVSNITGKVKEAAETTGVRQVYEKGTSKAKAYGNIAKLMLQENGETEELKKVYIEIGKLCYEQSKDEPEGFFAPLFAQVKEITERINSMDAEISALKEELGLSKDSDIDVEICDFEEVVSADENENKGE